MHIKRNRLREISRRDKKRMRFNISPLALRKGETNWRREIYEIGFFISSYESHSAYVGGSIRKIKTAVISLSINS